MKLYRPSTVIEFGKFEGYTISEVIMKEPDYVFWCLDNLDHFVISIGCLELLNTYFEDKKNHFQSFIKPDSPIGQQLKERGTILGIPKEYVKERDAEWMLINKKLMRYDEFAENQTRGKQYKYSQADSRIERENFDALTDGQFGSWEDFDGDIDDVLMMLGRD